MTDRDQYKHIAVHTITFCLFDEDGNVLQDKNGNDIQFECKSNLNELQYMCEDIEVKDLEEIKNVPMQDKDLIRKIEEWVTANIVAGFEGHIDNTRLLKYIRESKNE
jgi:hypothetical protein|tara:strand:- start:24 stop:344 length:321 start_codon:yes stop_codon:yes gene_type:complete